MTIAEHHPREPHRAVRALLQTQLSSAVARRGFKPRALPSGAGHDGMAIVDIADIGMIFVRCRARLSQHPDEHVAVEDADAGARVLLDFIENFRDDRGATANEEQR